MEATEIALSPLREEGVSEVSETEKGEAFLRIKGHSAKKAQGHSAMGKGHSP